MGTVLQINEAIDRKMINVKWETSVVPWRGAPGFSSPVKIKRHFWGAQLPSREHMVGWMNSLLCNVSCLFTLAFHESSVNNANIIEQFAIFIYNHCCLCLSSQMHKDVTHISFLKHSLFLTFKGGTPGKLACEIEEICFQ